MPTVTFHPARLHGSVSVPPSEREAHRALLLAALGCGECRLHGFSPTLCENMQAMLRGIAALGARVTAEGDVLYVQPAPPLAQAGKMAEFHAGACAAALHMLIPAFWVRGHTVRITMEDSVLASSMDSFAPMMEQMQMTKVLAKDGAPAGIELRGKLDAGAHEVDGALPCQFTSGLLIALAHATDPQGRPAPSRLLQRPPTPSRPDWDMTLSLMKRFRIPFEELAEGEVMLPIATQKSPSDIRVGGDWSQAATLLCANALGSGVMVRGLERPKAGEKPLQSDAQILTILRQMGLLAYETRNEMYVTSPSRAGLMPLDIDCTDIQELVPILALSLTQARGVSTLTGLGQFGAKEWGSLAAAQELLTRLDAKVFRSQDLNTLTVEGRAGLLHGGFTADAGGDPHIVTLLATAALIADAPITATGVEALDQSWPTFLESYQALGGNLS